MPSMITVIGTLLVCMVSMARADYVCNCYCPTSSNYVGYGTLSSPSTTCDAQSCANGCVGVAPACVLGSTWGSCRNAGNGVNDANGVNVSILSLMLGLTVGFLNKYF